MLGKETSTYVPLERKIFYTLKQPHQKKRFYLDFFFQNCCTWHCFAIFKP